MSTNRRKFLKHLGSSAVLLGAGSFTSLEAKEQIETKILFREKRFTINNQINIATIGLGIMGFQDTSTAIKVPGVKLIACCDLYNGRLQRAKELYGNDIHTTKNYEEILDRKDIDAVIVATSDHWHSKICVEAMQKGKHVYDEKPMIHKIDQGWDVINAQRKTKKVMQVGSQGISGLVYAKAKELYNAGDIGQINSVEAYFDRQSALGAWQYTMPPDQSTQTVDWEKYQSICNKKHAYDPRRFFWWRNYQEYGTGVAGDLYVHLLTGLHFITGAKGPSKIFSIGGTTYWKDGRDVPDVMTAVLEYPENKEHPSFQVSLRVNFVSGRGETGNVTIVGSEGVLDFTGGGFTIHRSKMSKAPGIGAWDALDTYPVAMQKQIKEAYNKKYSAADQAIPKLSPIKYKSPDNEDALLDHFTNFFDGIRTGKTIVEDPVFGFRACAPCLLCNESYFQNKVMHWDAENMKLIG
jgi:predicted dehydrogenase